MYLNIFLSSSCLPGCRPFGEEDTPEDVLRVSEIRVETFSITDPASVFVCAPQDIFVFYLFSTLKAGHS